jgi:hypothetical protein
VIFNVLLFLLLFLTTVILSDVCFAPASLSFLSIFLFSSLLFSSLLFSSLFSLYLNFLPSSCPLILCFISLLPTSLILPSRVLLISFSPFLLIIFPLPSFSSHLFSTLLYSSRPHPLLFSPLLSSSPLLISYCLFPLLLSSLTPSLPTTSRIQYGTAVLTINEIRTGISSIMAVLDANRKTLSGLPM